MGDYKDPLISSSERELIEVLEKYPDIQVIGYNDYTITETAPEDQDYSRYCVHITKDVGGGEEESEYIPVIFQISPDYLEIYFTSKGIEYFNVPEGEYKRMLDVARKGLEIIKAYQLALKEGIDEIEYMGRVSLSPGSEHILSIETIEKMLKDIDTELGKYKNIDI